MRDRIPVWKEANLAENLVFLDHPPLLFSIVKRFGRRGIRGACRLTRLLENRGYFRGKIVRYEISEGFPIWVPIYRPERWDRFDLSTYEHNLIETLVQAASARNLTLDDHRLRCRPRTNFHTSGCAARPS